MVIDLEVIHGRTVQGCLVAVLNEPGVEVARHTVVRAGVGTVGRDIYFDEPIALEAVVLGSGCANDSVGGQHDDTAVVMADANLVLGTDHAIGLNAAQLALLDDELLIAVIELGAKRSHDDLLAGSHIGGTADNLRDRS